ncbi:MAG TPA: hypothetical protein VLB80_04620 [Candidatus Babeliales bacterium]|nr:hypothetical protein [Candidatus Babeliales bacterium]
MKKITYLAIIMTLTNATTGYCAESSSVIAKLSDWYKNWRLEMDYKKTILKPLTKIIRESAKNKEKELDAKICHCNEQLSILNDFNIDEYDGLLDERQVENAKTYLFYDKKDLEREKEAFHNLATNPHAYLQYRDAYYMEARKMHEILHEENKGIEHFLYEQFRAKRPEAKGIPIRTILMDKIRRNNELTSAEEFYGFAN